VRCPRASARGLWALCRKHRDFIAGAHAMEQPGPVTKIRKLLNRQGVFIPYGTLYRFAVQELGLRACPGHDACGRLRPRRGAADRHGLDDLAGDRIFRQRRRLRAWIFHPSGPERHRFGLSLLSPRARPPPKLRGRRSSIGGIFKV